MFGMGMGGMMGMLNPNPLGAMSGTSSSLMTLFGGGLGEEGATLENMGMAFMSYFEGGQTKTRIKDIKGQTRMYGKMIPEIFGKMRVAGNIIWHSQIIINTITNPPQMSKTGQVTGGGSTTTARASFAIALGQGVIDGVDAIYANEVAINLSGINYTVYNGDETQMPNSTMQAYLGAANVPAFRGLAYIVFDNFPLEQYNNSVPNFTFDVRRTNFLEKTIADKIKPEQMITGVNIIPASGESVYDTIVQTKHQMIQKADSFGNITTIKSNAGTTINKNTGQNKADFLVSMDQMKATLPNLKWVSLVVTWFTDSTNIATANIYPAHEGYGYETFPDNWSVAGLTRNQAKKVSVVNGNLNYGGTVSDVAVVRAIKQLKAMGYQVCFYPMIFVDTPTKPWRGRITGKATDLANFFSKSTGYTNFIKHYANLTKGLVDAFVIGSEMIGLTSINSNNTFPAVQQFVDLAATIKQIVTPTTKLTYAADWSEYHHTAGGWFNMDPLWASPNIDFIGIDAYFPLTNSSVSVADVATIQNGWTSGEGWDFYYTDSQKTIKVALEPKYAWKNIEYFYKNIHTNPDGTQTGWVPSSKPFWFTEYGFPSIDCATNQPNIFYDPTSSENGVPLNSKGTMDIQTQRIAIAATEQKWLNSTTVVQKNIWVWDARPYPAFPALKSVWSDSINWQYGHFLNGKLGSVGSLADIIKYLCIEAGINKDLIDTTDLHENVLGFVIDGKTSAIDNIATLVKIFNFDAHNNGGKFVFKMLKNCSYYQISSDEILMHNSDINIIIEKNCDSVANPGTIELIYTNPNDSYKTNTICASIDVTNEKIKKIKNTHKTAIALTSGDALKAAFNIGFTDKSNNTRYKFRLSIKYANILPMDIIQFVYLGVFHSIRVKKIQVLDATSIEIEGNLAPDNFGTSVNPQNNNLTPAPDNVVQIIPTMLNILDINNTDNSFDTDKITLYAAVNGTILNAKWSGCQLYVSYDNGSSYNFVQNITNQSIVGQIINLPNNNINANTIDYASKMTVFFDSQPNLQSINIDSLFGYNNLVLAGDEILSYKNITQIDKNTFCFDTILRGRFGTEKYINKHTIGERFILLNKSLLTKIAIPTNAVGQTVYFKAVSMNDSIYNTDSVKCVIAANSNRSFDTTATICNLANKDFNISFVPRPHYENSFYTSPQNSNFNYNIMINKNGSAISQINANNISSVTYLEQDQIADFNTPQTAIDYNVSPAIVF